MAKTTQFYGIKPFSFQKDVINELTTAKGTGKNVVVVSRRQVGKTVLISNILLYYAINFSKTKNYCLSPTQKQGKNIFRSIIDAISGSGIIKTKNATDLTITLINGSTINFKSAEQREALRGETCTGILAIDEAAYISDDIFHIVTPWCNFHKAPKLIVSSPFVKSGFFFQYYNYGLNKTHNTVSINWSDEKYYEDLNKILSEEQLEEYRKILPKNVFKSEYLGQFLDDDGSVFTEFKKCVRKNTIKPTDKLYVGIDWATGDGNDDTAISMINQFGQQVFLAYFNNISPTAQIDWIDGILKQYLNQIVCIQPELNSLGTPMTDFLKNRSQIYANKIRGFDTTNKSKNNLVTQLQVAFEQGKIEILDDTKQLSELSVYTATVNMKTKNISYNAPQGLNDDICIALMLSYDAYKNGSTMGVYNVR